MYVYLDKVYLFIAYYNIYVYMYRYIIYHYFEYIKQILLEIHNAK